MNLREFQISRLPEYVAIDFNDKNLIVLEEFLNGNMQSNEAIDFYLDRCYNVRDRWNTPELHNYIMDILHGYWDDDYLQEMNLSGHWFSIINKENVNGGIHLENESFHLEDEFSNNPTISMPFSEFIDILEQWRAIINELNFV